MVRYPPRESSAPRHPARPASLLSLRIVPGCPAAPRPNDAATRPSHAPMPRPLGIRCMALFCMSHRCYAISPWWPCRYGLPLPSAIFPRPSPRLQPLFLLCSSRFRNAVCIISTTVSLLPDLASTTYTNLATCRIISLVCSQLSPTVLKSPGHSACRS